MSSILVGLLLAAFGLLCHWRGARARAFASERAEFLPANLLVQAAAMAWLLPAIPPPHAAGLLFLQLAGVSVVACGGGLWLRMPRCLDTTAPGPGRRYADRAATPRWQAHHIRSGS